MDRTEPNNLFIAPKTSKNRLIEDIAQHHCPAQRTPTFNEVQVRPCQPLASRCCFILGVRVPSFKEGRVGTYMICLFFLLWIMIAFLSSNQVSWFIIDPSPFHHFVQVPAQHPFAKCLDHRISWRRTPLPR